MKNLIKVFVLFILLSSCDKESKRNFMYNGESVPSVEMVEDMEISEAAYKKVPQREHKIIKTSFLSFETDSIEKTFQKIKIDVEKYKGFIQSDNTTKEYNQVRRNLVVRIPTSNFQPVIDHISKEVQTFDRKSISLKDVTEEFIDLEARLKAKKSLENRYLQLLNKAKNVKEMLEIEREIANIREEIEAKQGRLNYLKNQVSYSTINLEFYEVIPVVKSKSKTYFSKVIYAFKGGFKTLGDFILGLLYIWPFVIIIGITLYYLRKRIIKRRNK
jgi:hypothetical protein